MKRILIIALLAAVPMLIASQSFGSAPKWSVEEVLRAYLLENYPWHDVEVQNVKLSAMAPAEAPSRIAVESETPGRASFVLYFEHAAELRATAEVRAFETVLIPRYPMSKGHLIAEDELYASSADVLKLPPGTIHDASQVIGKPLSRPIGAGRPLTDDMIGTPARDIVKRGCKVLIVASTDGLTVTAAGVLRENGKIGSTVKVQNLSSDRVITGVLVDGGTVKVVF